MLEIAAEEDLQMEIRHLEVGIVKGRCGDNNDLVVVLSRDFPWSPTVLTLQYKLKVYVSSNSPLLILAREYFSRFGLEIAASDCLNDFYSDCSKAKLIVDEGWNFSAKDLRQFGRLGRIKPVFRLTKGYNLSLNDNEGGVQGWRARHSDVGGVTDLEAGIIRWYSKTKGFQSLPRDSTIPTRDLRSILKSGVEGKSSAKPVFTPLEPVGTVVTLRPGVISAAGLYPLNAKTSSPPAVRTKYGDKSWVTRSLVSAELLALKDIPETIFLMIKHREDETVMTRSIFDSCRIPLKLMSTLLVPLVAAEIHGKPLGRYQELSARPDVKSVPSLRKTKVMEAKENIDEWQASRLTDEELKEEEELCATSLELVEVLSRRLMDNKSELRSKRSDYELPSETIWDVRTLPYCRIRDEGGNSLDWRSAFRMMRVAILTGWKRAIRRSLERYKESQEGGVLTTEDEVASRDCLLRVNQATLWSWDGGSRPFFWNWGSELRAQLRDGFRMWLRTENIKWNEPQPKPSDKNRPLMIKKLQDVRDKGYLEKGETSSLIRYFGVPKGDSDIRMVYDGTKSGLNAALWAPWFPLPTASSHLRMIECDSWMADNDAGEFFLNWMMDSRVRNLCGVDLTHFLTEKEQDILRTSKDKRWIEKWTRCAMGLRPSPYLCVKGMLLAKEVILGDRHDPTNVFRWDHVLLNLPGMSSYDSRIPWVSKRRKDGSLAADLVCFVDDLRPVAPTEAECWEASQVVSKKMAWLGLQDASRKRNPPSQTPGPWAGIVVTTDGRNASVSVSQKKWDKAKEHVKELQNAVTVGSMNYKSLESKTGYLVYVAQAYPCLKPYLAGLYGTLNSWRSGWDSSGWKISGKSKRQKLNKKPCERDFETESGWQFGRLDLEDDETCESLEDSACPGLEKPPVSVQFVDRAKDDVAVLAELLIGELPPLRRIRGCGSVSLLYGFGDASGKGFGAALECKDKSYFFQAGLWGETFSEAMSSNYRELRNLVDFVHKAAEEGILDGCQLLLFTDNIVADYAFHKGGSKSKRLHELVLKLRKLEMSLSAELMIVHVSGLRMIESGVDGVSRGEMNTGIMAGQSIESIMPLHLCPLERASSLKTWILSWTGNETEFLVPDRWPEVHEGGGTYVWTPPPAAASAAIDWLGESIQKRSSSIHVVVVPRVMTSMWKKTLAKMSDFELEVPCDIVKEKEAGDSKDPNVSVISNLPCLECGLVMLAACGILCANYSAKRGKFAACKGFWCGTCYGVSPEANQFPIKSAMDMGPDGVMEDDPREKGRFLTARPGDHLMHEFQCDCCHFRNIQKRDPNPSKSAEDFSMLMCIRRANLDALWSKEPTTIEHNRREFMKILAKGKINGLSSIQLFKVKRSHRLHDDCNMALASTMMVRSLDTGRNDTHVQFNTVRGMRTAASNYWRASTLKEEISIMMRGQMKLTGSSSPTNTIWFEHFMLGFHKRVGDVHKPDKAVSIDLMIALMNRFEEEWEVAVGDRMEEKKVVFPALFALSAYVASLRGEEVPLMDLQQTREKTYLGLQHPSNPHVVLSLSGRFKNEIGSLKYHIPIVEVTQSGLNVRQWLERMLGWYGPDRKGYVFRDNKGHRITTGFYADKILGLIRQIQQSGRPEEYGIVEPDCDVFEEFGLSRSFRRGSDSRALAAGVSQATIDLINRWRTTERAKGRTAQLKMSAHYSDIRLLLELYLPYSRSL